MPADVTPFATRFPEKKRYLVISRLPFLTSQDYNELQAHRLQRGSIMRFSLFPHNLPEQSYRIKRTLLAFAFYCLCGAVIKFCAWQGMYPQTAFAVYAMGALSVSLAFYIAIRSGWNLRFSDPSLTEAQIFCSIILCSYVQIHSGPFRGVFMFAYLVALMFSGSKLSTWQLARLAILPASFFPLIAFLAHRLYPGTVDWRIEFVNWISVCVILAFVAMLVGNLSRLSKRLKTSNAELQATMMKLTDMAVHDELTGLYNRRYLNEMLAREKGLCNRRSDGVFCICMFDIDHFKRVNDTYGHSGGDIVLSTFATLACQFIRTTDVLARWGGEEFLLLLPHTSIKFAQLCVERIQAGLEKTAFDGLPPSFRVTVSIGIAQYRPDETIEQMIDRADHALYRAKGRGRNCIVEAEESLVA